MWTVHRAAGLRKGSVVTPHLFLDGGRGPGRIRIFVIDDDSLPAVVVPAKCGVPKGDVECQHIARLRYERIGRHVGLGEVVCRLRFTADLAVERIAVGAGDDAQGAVVPV